MVHSDDDPWREVEIRALIAELISDRDSPRPDSPPWAWVRMKVLTAANRYGRSQLTYLDDADDLTQDVMMVVATPGKLESFLALCSPDLDEEILHVAFHKWLARIVQNVWRGRARYYTADLRSRFRTLSLQSESAAHPYAELPIADPGGDVATIAERAALFEAVGGWLASLWAAGGENPKKIMRFILGGLLGLPYKMVAEVLDCTPGQVRDAVHEVRLILREMQEQFENGDALPLPPGQKSPGQITGHVARVEEPRKKSDKKPGEKAVARTDKRSSPKATRPKATRSKSTGSNAAGVKATGTKRKRESARIRVDTRHPPPGGARAAGDH